MSNAGRLSQAFSILGCDEWWWMVVVVVAMLSR
jgi:hypothetical protein